MFSMVLKILGGILFLLGILSWYASFHNMKMVQQDPSPSQQDKNATGVFLLLAMSLLIVGGFLIALAS